MSYSFKKCLLSAGLSCILPAIVYGQAKKWTIRNQELKHRWQIQSSAAITTGDQEISTKNFNPAHWYTTDVPHTVLAALVDNGVYRNIFFGRNLEKIPDSLFNVPWWYRTVFPLPKPVKGQDIRLLFNGINYRADIWVNGHKVAAADTVEGGFRRFIFDITNVVTAGSNILAVKVTGPRGGEPTLGFVDWNPGPPDHSMGIVRDVHLLITGPVSIDLPFIQTKVDTATLDHAGLTISAVLSNHSGKVIHGILKGETGDHVRISQPVTMLPAESKKIVFSPGHYKQLVIEHPRLWWTHDLGQPNLYNLQLIFVTDNEMTDRRKIRFGIRSVSDYITAEGSRGYRLNGKKILIRGGGWTDPLLLNATPAYERAGIDYAVQMNLNTIRMEGFWGHDQHLYDLCDKKGILIMAGWSAEWEWEGPFGAPADKYGGIKTPGQITIAARSWKDQLTWLRNHPSIFLWLYGSDKFPRPALEEQYLDILKNYDPTRPWVASAAEHTSTLTGPTGVKMRGPYDYVPPDYWYRDTMKGGAFGFNTETSPGPEIPVLQSLKKMIPADSLWPAGSAWMFHAARGNFHNLNYYNKAMDNRLGKPVDLEDYLRKAQYLNYEGMRAMFEAFEANRFKATGIIQWMYNSAWPKLWWQLYDYYLMPTGAFYGARKAGEPLHISYNYGNNSIDVMNNTLKKAEALSASIEVLNADGKPVMSKKMDAPALPGQTTVQLMQLPADISPGKTWFLALRLQNNRHQLVSANFYALSSQQDELDTAKATWYVTPESQYADLTALQHLPPVRLTVRKQFEQRGDTSFVKVTLKNQTARVAFMIYLDLRKKTGNESLAPVFWNDNYITLLPGEERSISGYCHTKDLQGGQAAVAVSGWNVEAVGN